MATAKRGSKASELLLEQERQRSTAREWKKRKLGEDVRLPSGEVALVRRIGPEAFLGSGKIPDALAPMIDDAIRGGQGLPPEKVKESFNDPKQIMQMLELMDRIVVMAVIDPPCAQVPPCTIDKGQGECLEGPLSPIHSDRSTPGWHIYAGQERSDDIIYVDEIDLEDKQFIMNFAMGGTRDLERFRRESSEYVEPVSDGEDVGVSS